MSFLKNIVYDVFISVYFFLLLGLLGLSAGMLTGSLPLTLVCAFFHLSLGAFEMAWLVGGVYALAMILLAYALYACLYHSSDVGRFFASKTALFMLISKFIVYFLLFGTGVFISMLLNIMFNYAGVENCVQSFYDSMKLKRVSLSMLNYITIVCNGLLFMAFQGEDVLFMIGLSIGMILEVFLPIITCQAAITMSCVVIFSDILACCCALFLASRGRKCVELGSYFGIHILSIVSVVGLSVCADPFISSICYFLVGLSSVCSVYLDASYVGKTREIYFKAKQRLGNFQFTTLQVSIRNLTNEIAHCQQGGVLIGPDASLGRKIGSIFQAMRENIKNTQSEERIVSYFFRNSGVQNILPNELIACMASHRSLDVNTLKNIEENHNKLLSKAVQLQIWSSPEDFRKDLDWNDGPDSGWNDFFEKNKVINLNG